MLLTNLHQLHQEGKITSLNGNQTIGMYGTYASVLETMLLTIRGWRKIT